jgi:hypothetical protein
MKIYRQGDVLIRRVRALPKDRGAEIARDDRGRLILAAGEATGHHHAIDALAARLFRGEKPGVCYLLLEEPATLGHEEHAPIALAPGNYEVIRQREYSPEAIRNVAD